MQEQNSGSVIGFRKEDANPVLVVETFRDGKRSLDLFVDYVEQAIDIVEPPLDSILRRFLTLKDAGKTALVTWGIKDAESMVSVIKLTEGKHQFAAIALNPQFHLAFNTTNLELQRLEARNVLHKVQHCVQEVDRILESRRAKLMTEDKFHLLMMTDKSSFQLICVDDFDLVDRRQ